MTYRLVMVTYHPPTGTEREVITHIAGCTDTEDAKAKALQLYHVRKFKKVEPVTAQPGQTKR